MHISKEALEEISQKLSTHSHLNIDFHLHNEFFNFLRSLLENNIGYIYWKDKDLIYKGCNDLFLNEIELNHKSEVIGRTDTDFEREFGWEVGTANELIQNDLEVIHSGKSNNYEEIFISKNGKKIVMQTSKTPIFDNQGEVIGIFASSFNMKPLHNNQKKIKELEDKIYELDSIIAQLPGNVYWYSKDLEYLGCSENSAKTLNLKRYEAVGKNFRELMGQIKNVTQETIDRFIEDGKTVIETGKPMLNIEEPPFIGSDGKLSYWIANKVPLCNQRGEAYGVIGISTNITNQKNLEFELSKQKQKAESASRAKSEFIDNMSHDIRTPIAGMLGMIQDLLNISEKIKSFQKSSEILPKNFSQLLEDSAYTVERDSTILLNSTNSLLKLCNEVLDAAKLEFGQTAEKTEAFNLTNLIRDNIFLLSPVAQNRNLELSAEIDENIPKYLEGIRLYLERIILNLTSNALKFTKRGFVKITATKASQKDDEVILQIIVEDSGIGIPKDKFETIFEHFTKLSASSEENYKGSGLGLYTVKHYLKAMNGTIKVESQLNMGTKFILNIPFRIADTPEQQEDIPEVKDTFSSQSEKSNKRILIVEDNLAIRLGLELSLHNIKHHIDFAESGKQAIEKARNSTYDLIFMDIGLPDMSGLEVTRNIRTHSKNANTPIMALTAHLASEKWEECEAAGMQDLVSKPIDGSMLRALLERFLGTDVVSS